MRGMLISWAAAWPTITVLLLITEKSIAHWPLAMRTFLLTGLMVPLMSFLLVPAVSKVFKHLGFGRFRS